MLGVERVDFVSVPVRDLARAVEFYETLIGLHRDPRARGELEAGNVTLALWVPEDDGVPFAPNTAGVALRVTEVKDARRRLEDAGVPFLGDTVDTGVCRMAFCTDPDGNVLILHRRYAP